LQARSITALRGSKFELLQQEASESLSIAGTLNHAKSVGSDILIVALRRQKPSQIRAGASE